MNLLYLIWIYSELWLIRGSWGYRHSFLSWAI